MLVMRMRHAEVLPDDDKSAPIKSSLLYPRSSHDIAAMHSDSPEPDMLERRRVDGREYRWDARSFLETCGTDIWANKAPSMTGRSDVAVALGPKFLAGARCAAADPRELRKNL